MEIVERTISVTSAALDATGEDYDVNNVGTEPQYYRISARNRSSVDTENFVVSMDFDDIRAHGMEVRAVYTPTTNGGDKDGGATVSYRLEGDADWTVWADVEADAPAVLVTADVAGEGKLAALKIDYGKVASDFALGSEFADGALDLVFECIYTTALPKDTAAVVHAVEVRTDLAITAETTIWADDEDRVRTVFIEPAIVDGGTSSLGPGWRLPSAGDTRTSELLALGAVAGVALAVMATALIIRNRKEDKR